MHIKGERRSCGWPEHALGACLIHQAEDGGIAFCESCQSGPALYIKISFFLLWFTIHCPGLHQQQITLQRCAVIFLFLDHLCLITKRNVIKAPFQVPTETCQLI